MAHKKGEGSVKNGRDSQSKRLGVNGMCPAYRATLLPKTGKLTSRSATND